MSNTHYITALRFPLALLVVFIHTHNAQWQLIETGSAPTLASFLSGILPTFAVPLFFALSGYLFFYKVSAFSLDCYVGKVRRRMLTLAVPYLLWNLIAFGLYALQSKLSGHALAYPFSPELWWNCRELAAPFTNVWGFTVGASTAPIQPPPSRCGSCATSCSSCCYRPLSMVCLDAAAGGNSLCWVLCTTRACGQTPAAFRSWAFGISVWEPGSASPDVMWSVSPARG